MFISAFYTLSLLFWQDERDELVRDMATKEVTLKAMKDSTETIQQEKAAFQASLGSQLKHRDRSNEEQVKDIDESNHVPNGDSGSNQNGHAENGGAVAELGLRKSILPRKKMNR
jgi:hypothetical protein